MTMNGLARYESANVGQVGERAAVVGGSMAGLAAARVLADAFDETVVIERDPMPDEPVSRDGAPQSEHAHVLLEAGRATLEQFFPGFGENVIRRGGLMIDAATELRYYDQGDFLASEPSQLPMMCASRALFEHVTRERVRALEGVEFRDECQFLTYEHEGGAGITGVRYRDEDGDERALETDLVVDATGRASRTPAWLADNGFDAPETDEVTVDLTYSTIRLDRPADERRALLVQPSPPQTRGAAMIPVENGRWEFALQGIHGDDPPTERETFVEFAESIPVAEVGRLVTEHDWSSEVHQYPFPSNVRRHYERLDRVPDGLVVTGDAVASFNPVYGQGMSVGALDALVLHHTLAEIGMENLSSRYFQRIADPIDQVWQLAVGVDFEYPQTTGPKPFGTDLFNLYVKRLIRRAHADGELSEALHRVFRLERPATSLLRPGIAWRVLRPRTLS